MSWFNIILPLVALIIGYALTLLTESRRDHRQRTRDVEVRAEVRRQAIVDRRESFELVNLTDAYSALTDLARAASLVHSADTISARNQGGKYAQFPLEDASLDEGKLLAVRASSAASNLILTDAIRAKATKAHWAFAALGNSPVDLDEADAQWGAAAQVMQDALEAIAARIREIYVFGEPA